MRGGHRRAEINHVVIKRRAQAYSIVCREVWPVFLRVGRAGGESEGEGGWQCQTRGSLGPCFVGYDMVIVVARSRCGGLRGGALGARMLRGGVPEIMSRIGRRPAAGSRHHAKLRAGDDEVYRRGKRETP